MIPAIKLMAKVGTFDRDSRLIMQEKINTKIEPTTGG